MTISITIVPDTEATLEAEITALESDIEQTIIEGMEKLNHLRDRLADLTTRLKKFEPSTKQ